MTIAVSSVQSLSGVWLFVTPWTAALQASLSIINSWRLLLKLMSFESVMPSNYLICCPLLLLPSIIPSIRVFSNESAPPSDGQSTGVSASASVLPMNIQDLLSLGWTGCISLLSKGLSRVFSNTTVQKHQFHDNLEMSISHMKKIRSEELTNLAKTWAACTKTKVNLTSSVSFYYKHCLIVDSEKMTRDTEITVQDQMYLGGIWICWVDWS